MILQQLFNQYPGKMISNLKASISKTKKNEI